MSDSAAPIRMLGLHIENLRCLRIFDLDEPKGHVVELRAKNGEGKSTIIDSIEWCMRGKSASRVPSLRRGAEKGTAVLSTDKYTIQRTITKSGAVGLKFTDADGNPVKNPETTLSSFWSHMAADPLALFTMSPKDQSAYLAEVSGLSGQLAEFSAKRKALYDERTLVNREVATAEALVRAMPETKGPIEELTATALTAELTAAHETIAANREERALLAKGTSARDSWSAKVVAAKQKIEDLKQQIAMAEKSLAETEAKRDEATAWVAAKEVAVAELQDPDINAITVKMRDIETHNAQVRQRRERAAAASRLEAAKAKVASFERSIEDVDEAKREAIKKAALPVEGLEFDEDTVTYLGTPLAELSTAEQIRVGVAVVLAKPPMIRLVPIRRGESLDDDSMDVLRAEMEKHNAVAIVERVVSDAAGDGILIYEGSEG